MQVVTRIMRFVMAVILCAIASPVWADFQAGYDAYQRGDYATALREWKPLANQGNGQAQHNLGLMYSKGLGVEQDYAEAAKWYRKAANQGVAYAEHNLGAMYEDGQGVSRDYAEALKWYRRAAEQGLASSQTGVGAMYRKGHGVVQDYAEAVKWYLKAAIQGFAYAQTDLGVMYAEGQGVPQDIAEALKWYRRAAEQGHAQAQFNLGVMYRKGHGVPQDYAEALKWYRRAAEQGSADAQNGLGGMHRRGQGVPQDYAEAVKWYRKAAKQGYAIAQHNLGVMYKIGQGVPQDFSEAVKWFRKAVDQGNVIAQFNLGTMYHSGKGVPQDYAEALKWYRKAAEQGYAGAQHGLGFMYAKGQGVPQDYEEAYLWFSLSAAQGKDAQKSRDLIAQHLSSTQLAHIQQRASQWRASAVSPTATASNNPSSPSQATLIRNLQSRLTELGYAPGPNDGVMGRMTRNAIKAFQRDEGLPATGKASETLAELMKTKLASRQEPPQPAAPIQTADLGTFHALIIGNNAYRALPRLRTAVKDARAVAELLQSRYGFRATTLTDATRDDVIQALQKMRNQLSERDNLLIYYAGHGKLDRGSDRGYWLPIDATDESPVNWINNVTITDSLKAIQAKHVMVVADSCYSGTLTRDTRGIKVRVKKSDYIAKTHRKKSRTVLASGGLEPVSDSGGSGHSVFAKAFMDALRDNEGVIDGLDVFSYVRKQVRLNADQVPNYANIRYAGHEVGGDFLFARKLE